MCLVVGSTFVFLGISPGETEGWKKRIKFNFYSYI